MRPRDNVRGYETQTTMRKLLSMGITSLRQSARLFCCLSVGLGPIIGTAMEDNSVTLEEQLHALHQKASAAKESSDFVRVEELRLERMRLLREHAKADNETLGDVKPWMRALHALEEVDGISAATALLVPTIEAKQGLVDRCEYKKAFEVLKSAWSEFKKSPALDEQPALGELAVRMFEVIQQAKAVNWGVEDRHGKNFIASYEEIREIVEEAHHRDPCLTVSAPILQFLTPPDPKEAFLTADVRTDLKERQAKLLAMSHPLVEVNAAILPRATDWPVLPVHATTELLKAINLRSILNDLELTRHLTRDLLLVGDGKPSYVVPGSIVDLVDSGGERVQVLYGRVLMSILSDSKGRRRSCVIYLDTTSRKPKWKKLYLNVMVYRPEGEPYPLDVSRLLEQQILLKEIDLNGSKVALFDYPINYTKHFLKEELHILRVKDANELLDTSFKPTRNDPKFLARELSGDKSDPIQPSPYLLADLAKQAGEQNRNRHALVSFFENTPTISGKNAVIVASDDDGTSCEPGWFLEHGGDEGAAELRTLDGNVFRVHSNINNEQGAYFELEQPGGNLIFPLNWQGIPNAVIASAEQGQDLLAKARTLGLDSQELLENIKQMWSGKLRRQPKEFASLFQPALPNSTPENNSKRSPSEIFKTYGFRHLRDNRGNLILHQEYVDANRDNDSNNAKSALQFAYAMRSADGLAGLTIPQIYDWYDYQEIQYNIVNEHLTRMASLHPCLDSLSVLASFANTPLVNPSEKPPEWLDDNYIVTGRNVTNDSDTKSGIVPYVDYKNHFVQPKAFISLERLQSVIGKKAKPSVVEPLNRLSLVYQSLWVEMPEQSWCTKHNSPTEHNSPPGCSQCAAEAEKESEGPQSPEQEGNRNATAFLKSQREFFSDWIYEISQEQSGQEQSGSFKFSQLDISQLDRYLPRMSVAEQAQAQRVSAIRGLLIDAARFYARQKKFHHAIIHYNDALEVLEFGLPTDRISRSKGWRDLSLLGEVPDSTAARNFVDKLRRAFIEERAALSLELELAGVLRSAGKKASALRVFSQVALTAEFYINPLIEVAKEFFAAYGINADDELVGVINEIQELFRIADAAFLRAGGGERYYYEGLNDLTRPQGLGDLLRTLADVGSVEFSNRSSEQAGKFKTAVESLPRLIDKVSFEDWVRVKRLAQQQGLSVGSSQALVDPLVRTPFHYDASGQRFVHSGFDSLFQTAGRAYSRFRGEENDWAPNNAEDEYLCYLFGAYWKDRGESTKARLAFAAASRSFQQRAQQTDSVEEKLVAQMNAFWCLVVMESVTGKHDGLQSLGLDFVDGLRGQLFAWSRRWFAAGLHGPAATGQRRLIDHTLQLIDRGVDGKSRTRWFFPDYQSEIGGPIPDPYLLRFFEERPLDEIEKDNAAVLAKAVEVAAIEKESNNGEETREKSADGEGGPTPEDKIAALKQEIRDLQSKNIAAIDAVLGKVVDKYSRVENIKINEDIVLGAR